MGRIVASIRSQDMIPTISEGRRQWVDSKMQLQQYVCQSALKLEPHFQPQQPPLATTVTSGNNDTRSQPTYTHS